MKYFIPPVRTPFDLVRHIRSEWSDGEKLVFPELVGSLDAPGAMPAGSVIRGTMNSPISSLFIRKEF